MTPMKKRMSDHLNISPQSPDSSYSRVTVLCCSFCMPLSSSSFCL